MVSPVGSGSISSAILCHSHIWPRYSRLHFHSNSRMLLHTKSSRTLMKKNLNQIKKTFSLAKSSNLFGQIWKHYNTDPNRTCTLFISLCLVELGQAHRLRVRPCSHVAGKHRTPPSQRLIPCCWHCYHVAPRHAPENPILMPITT